MNRPRFARRTTLLAAIKLLLVAPLFTATIITASSLPVERAVFGRTPDGKEVEAYTLRNANGAIAKIITYGAIVAQLEIPDANGNLVNVVREIAPSPQGFERGFPQSAAIFGRVANRIANARFTLDGREYVMTPNNGKHLLHGGRKNFSRVVWQGKPVERSDGPALELEYISPDGEEGFPGTLSVRLVYTVTRENTLRLEFRATSDKPTPINVTNHAFFNLAGRGDVLDHELTVNADRYTVVDAELIPTGEIKSVRGSPFDFTRPSKLGERVAALGATHRYDQNFVLKRPENSSAPTFAARVREPRSGLTMEVWTTEPGVQLFTSPLQPQGSEGRFGFYCLETQHFPDSVNHPHFPSTILRPSQTFRSTTEFRFSAK